MKEIRVGLVGGAGLVTSNLSSELIRMKPGPETWMGDPDSLV